MSKQQLEQNEERYFRRYLEDLYARFPRERLNYFEHNLEVWRQLWRVAERSDVVVIMADARHPLFNFPPSLYDYVNHSLRKPLVLVLNKVDLVPSSSLAAWREYFKTRFPQLHVVHFSSNPIPGTVTADNVDASKKRELVRRRLDNAHGVNELQEALRSVLREYPGLARLFAEGFADKLTLRSKVRAGRGCVTESRAH
jgi:predicted GTPase